MKEMQEWGLGAVVQAEGYCNAMVDRKEAEQREGGGMGTCKKADVVLV